jgi:hypothetical protein
MDTVKLHALQDNQQMLLELNVKMKRVHVRTMHVTQFIFTYIFSNL